MKFELIGVCENCSNYKFQLYHFSRNFTIVFQQSMNLHVVASNYISGGYQTVLNKEKCSSMFWLYNQKFCKKIDSAVSLSVTFFIKVGRSAFPFKASKFFLYC